MWGMYVVLLLFLSYELLSSVWRVYKARWEEWCVCCVVFVS